MTPSNSKYFTQSTLLGLLLDTHVWEPINKVCGANVTAHVLIKEIQIIGLCLLSDLLLILNPFLIYPKSMNTIGVLVL